MSELTRESIIKTYDNDLRIINYIDYNDKFKIFDKHKINYLVLDDLDIVNKKSYDDNNYYKYLNIVMLNKVIKKIRRNLIKTTIL